MSDRREFLAGVAATALLASCATTEKSQSGPVSGTEHWTTKKTPQGDVKLFMWRKRLADAPKGTVLFVHGSSVQSLPAFDLQVPGKPELSVMNWFARLGYDAWCFDCEGYGKSDKWRDINADIAAGADDLAVVTEYIVRETRNKLFMYGGSSGALRAGLFAQRHPERVQKLVLDALVWTGEGSPTLAERKKRLPQWRASNRRPIDRAFVRTIFTRDGGGDAYEESVIQAFTDMVLSMDNSMPTGTYVDMSANLPVIDPRKITVPTVILRGQWDGIASFEDLVKFFAALPNADKQFLVMPGIAHSSLRSKNWRMVFDMIDGYYARSNPVYIG